MEEERCISKEFVAKLLEPGIYRDDKYFGFCLKVAPSGRKVFQVRKRGQ